MTDMTLWTKNWARQYRIWGIGCEGKRRMVNVGTGYDTADMRTDNGCGGRQSWAQPIYRSSFGIEWGSREDQRENGRVRYD